MIPAHLRSYPSWVSWVDEIGGVILLGGSLLASEALSASAWIYLVCVVAAILVWDLIFSMIRDATTVSKQRKAN